MRKRLCCLLFVLLFLCSLVSCGKEDDTLRVTVLDAGQGDCILISQGESHILVDTASGALSGDVIAQLRVLGVKRLDMLLITHLHEDHNGNARVLLEMFRPDVLIVPKTDANERDHDVLLECAKESEVFVKTVADGWSFTLGNALCTVVKPMEESKDENDESLVLRVVFGTQSFLFMADVEKTGEECLISRYGASFLDCDFLKVGHHGTKDATTDAFLSITTPRFAAISAGKENRYGLPDGETLARLDAYGVMTYRTDKDGMLSFISDGREIRYDG